MAYKSRSLKFNPIQLKGNWKAGWAFDLHMLSSEYLGKNEYGHDEYKSIRSEMGELVYQLKYRHKKLAVRKIVDLLQKRGFQKKGSKKKNFKKNGFKKIDVVIPIPPSNKGRRRQPVFSIATEFGRRFEIKVLLNVLKKSKGSKELKNIDSPKKRKKALKSSMKIAKNYKFSGKNVLLIDDLYCSGSTLKVATKLLYDKGKAKNVYVLTMTKTRYRK